MGGNAKTTMFAMISPSSDNYDETMSTLRYAESAKKVMNRAVVNEDKNARIIRQLRQEIEQLRAELARKEGSPGKERVNAGLSASLVERESFYAELQKEVELFRSQQQYLSTTTAPRAIHLSDSLPSLVNMSANLVPGEALAYVLVEGTTLFGSDPNPDMTKYETVEVQHDHDISEEKEGSENASKPAKPKKRHGSWTSTMLRRRKSSSKSAPSTPSAKASRKGSKLDASEVAWALSADKRSVMQVCKLPGDEVSRILPRHARFTCTRAPMDHKAVQGEQDTTEYVVELESLDPTAILLVNGQPLEYGSEHPMKLHHGDQVRLGKPYCFRIHVPGYVVPTPRIAEAVEQPPELEVDKDEGRELEVLVKEANAICTKWVLNTDFVAASGISVTLKETASKANAELKAIDSAESSSEEIGGTPKIFSTPRVPPVQASGDGVSIENAELDKIFMIGEKFETAITAKKDNLFSHRTAEEESLLVEVWGYDVKLSRYMATPDDDLKPSSGVAMETQQVEFYVSVDVEEREVDGLYHPVAVKPDASGQDDNNDTSLAEAMTTTKVNLCLDEIFKRTDDEVQVFESVQFDSPELFLRHLRRTDLLMNLFTGKVDDLATVTGVQGSFENPVTTEDSQLKLREHVIHFVSEPTQLVGGDQLGGEMSGFLMLSLSSAMDEETAAAVVAPLGSTTVRPRTPPKASSHRVAWERQWFVLKRPFLYAYESFARKQQTGVMDLSLCQLIVSTASDVPFSFRLVCVDGRKQSAVWWLQASTSAEMRAWLVAIDPLKIEARQGVASTSPTATPALTA
ncbi:Kinesin-like protein [Phytophthora cinnamomi]|uniref:Kinesin-like protein n=1 Tax=Phytophthora cinnamomi TaxID=4785 RepID=UPI003559A8E6|nr:Kinesin-like protein [Phytophthora cinnamomi]